MTSSSRLPLTARCLVLVMLIGFAVLAWGSGIDRMAAYDAPQLRPLVPDAFAATSLAAQASQEMVAAHGAALLPLARKVEAREPFEPDSPSYLGAAYLLGRRYGAANTAFLAAADMGWRGPMTQIYWLGQAVALGDGDVAMTRLDALLRQKPILQSDRNIMDPVERTAEIRPQFLSLLASKPDWLGLYVANVAYMPPDQLTNRAGILINLAQSGTRLGCGSPINDMTRELYRIGQFELARALWASHCEAAGQGSLWDGALRTVTLADPGNPFAWQTHTSGDVNVDLATDGQGRTSGLIVSNAGAFAAPFLSQTLLLLAGAHTVVWHASGQGQSDVLLQFACGNNDPTRPAMAPAPGDHLWQTSIAVPPACPVAHLDFVVKAGASKVEFGSVQLRD